MRGGSLTRYHTPVLTKHEGKGLTEDLIKLAGPLVLQQAQAGLQDIQRGMSAADTWARRSAQDNRGLKRKGPPWPGRSVNTRPKIIIKII